MLRPVGCVLSTEAISDAVNSLNQGCLLAEFLPEAADDDIHHISAAVIVLLPDARQ
jgi:hypothetical protein